jgi:hypothetical protein
MRIFLILLTFIAVFYSKSVVAANIESEFDGDAGASIIYIDGQIAPDDDKKFRAISKTIPNAIVVLDSDGGSLLPALEIGKIIRVAGYSTIVTDDRTCASACALIWLAGIERGVIGGGKIGFHAAYRDNRGQLEEVGSANALIGGYLTTLGLQTKAILFATTAPPDRILWLSDVGEAGSGISYVHYDAPSRDSMSPRAPPPSIQRSERSASAAKTYPFWNQELISSMSRSGEKWIKFLVFNNSYYDYNSLVIEKNKRSVWLLYDFSVIEGSKSQYSLNQIETDCKKLVMRVARTVTKLKDDITYNRFYSPPPGSDDRAIMTSICSIKKP